MSLVPDNQPQALGELWRRVQILEAVDTSGRAKVRGDHKYSVQGPEWALPFSYNQWSATATQDLTAPFGGYADLGNSNGNRVGFGAPLGPSQTFWRVGMWYYTGPDYGKLQLNLATTYVNEIGATGGTYGTAYSIQDLFTPGAASWYVQDPVDGDWTLDGYAAVGAWAFNWFDEFWIMGPDGQQLSADGVTTPAGPRKAFADQSDFAAGGDDSVYWWVSVKVNGKNASSTGHKGRVAGLTCARITGSGYGIA